MLAEWAGEGARAGENELVKMIRSDLAHEFYL